MTNTQMFFAILLPTVTALIGIMVTNVRANATDARLMNVENGLSGLAQRVSHLEGALGGK